MRNVGFALYWFLGKCWMLQGCTSEDHEIFNSGVEEWTGSWDTTVTMGYEAEWQTPVEWCYSGLPRGLWASPACTEYKLMPEKMW